MYYLNPQYPKGTLTIITEKIEDPWHSRPIDVHRWSDHPEVVQVVDRVWDDYLPKEVVKGPEPKPKMSFRKQLRVLILDLYVAWLEDPELSIGVSRALHTSERLVDYRTGAAGPLCRMSNLRVAPS